MTTYSLCKSMILRKSYASKEDMQIKLDVFFAGNRITESQYQELTQLLASQD